MHRTLERVGWLPQTVDPDSEWRRHLTSRQDELAEGIAYWQALLDTLSGVVHSKDTVKPGDIITKGTGTGKARVVRANAKTVSVVFIDHPLVGWKAKVPDAEILEIVR